MPPSRMIESRGRALRADLERKGSVRIDKKCGLRYNAYNFIGNKPVGQATASRR